MNLAESGPVLLYSLARKDLPYYVCILALRHIPIQSPFWQPADLDDQQHKLIVQV